MVSNDAQLLEIDERKKEIKNFQSYYYQMNANADNTTKIFPQDVKVELDDIKNLNRSVADKFSHYDNAGFKINIQLQYASHKRLFFDSWQKFEEYQWYDDEPILSMAIKWEIMIVLPQFTIPQKHTLTVRISDQISPEEFVKLVFSGEIEDIAEFDKTLFPIYASMDYIDPLICEETLGIVEKWVTGLQHYNRDSRFISFIKERNRLVTDFIGYISDLIMCVCSILVIDIGFSKISVSKIGDIDIEDFKYMIIFLMVYFIAIYVIRKLIRIAQRTTREMLRTYGKGHVFVITNGDKEIARKIEERTSRKRLAIIGNILLTIILNILCGVFVNFIA